MPLHFQSSPDPVRSFVRRDFVDTPSGSWNVREWGEGVPLLLLHPTPYSSRYYLDLAPRFTGFRVIVPDLPGCGESAPLRKDASIDSVAAEVNAFMRAAGVPKAHVLAIHGGNKIGAALAGNHPDCVNRFVFVGMTHSIILDRTLRNAEVLAAAARTREPKAGTPGLADQWRDLFDSIGKVWSKGDVAAQAGDRESLRRIADEAIDRVQSREAFDALYQANFGFDLEAALRRTKAKSLIVELRVEHEARLVAQAPLIVAAMADARSVTLPFSDRQLVHEEADRFAELVSQFLVE
jgi:pimeloyl-ACP methyl ester carboxylesterase